MNFTHPPIKLLGVRQNNLKNIDIEIPQKKLTVVTGLSGSGKSTLAFETLYAEGQRRYVESRNSITSKTFHRQLPLNNAIRS
jgi:excinuclease ABC subunit A